MVLPAIDSRVHYSRLLLHGAGLGVHSFREVGLQLGRRHCDFLLSVHDEHGRVDVPPGVQWAVEAADGAL